MKDNQQAIRKAVEFNRMKSRRRIWYRVLTVLSAFVVFVTTYILILPAITLSDKPICGLTEHIHSENCTLTETSTVFSCAEFIHSHTTDCFDENNGVICGKADFAVHEHTELCYDEKGELRCPLPEIKADVLVNEAPDIKTESVTVKDADNTTQESSDAVISDVRSTDEPAASEESSVADEQTSQEITTEDNDTAQAESQKQEHNGDEAEKSEDNRIVLHSHVEACYASNGELVCGLVEVCEHIHSSQCIKTISVERKVCTFEEHTHDEVLCYSDNTADTESEADWVKTLPEELSGKWPVDLVEIAKSQVGYTESKTIINVGANGELQHYSRYGAWYGQPYSEWNQIFVSFCLAYTGIPEDVVLQIDSTEKFIEAIAETNFCYIETENIKSGDIVIFYDENGKYISGIVSDSNKYEEAKVPVVCGDINGSVAEIDCNTEDIVYRICIADIYDDYIKHTAIGLPPEKPQHLLRVSGKDFTVTVTFDDSAGLPENVQLKAEEITDDHSETDYFSETKNAIISKHKTDVSVAHIRVFDIGFYLDGTEVEPTDGSSVKVNITFTDNFDLTKSEKLDVIHFAADGSVEVINGVATNRVEINEVSGTSNEDNDSESKSGADGISVDFETDGFSVFAVAAAEDTPVLLAASGQYPLNPSVYWMYRSQKSSKFYWRFREQNESGDWLAYPGADGIGSAAEEQSNFTENGEPIVTVTFENSDGDNDSVPYFSYHDSLESGTYNKMLSLDNVLATDEMVFLDGSNWTKLKIETAEGYVVTSYSINCEWGTSDGSSKVGTGYSPGVAISNNKAENCQTAIVNDNQVDVDPTGHYRSNFYVDGHDNSKLSVDNSTLANAITETDCGHLSWGIAGSNYRYVLLLEVAKVNFEIDIHKSAEPEMVTAGETVTYTAVADFPSSNATEGVTYLNNVVFTDEFFKNCTVKSVKYISASGTQTVLTAASSLSSGTAGIPQSYYLNKTAGTISINTNGQWEKDGHFEIVYDYKTNTDISSTQTLTNTIFAVGNFDGATRKAYAVASVDVIVNSNQKGSIRIYKTFSGLTHDEVFDLIMRNQNAYKLQILQNGSPISVNIKGANNTLTTVNEITVDNYGIKFYSQTDDSITYYVDVLNLNQNSNYSVVESNFMYGDYVWNGTYSINGGSQKDLSANGATTTFSVVKGDSTQVDLMNEYADKIDVIIQKTGQSGQPIGGAVFLLQIDNAGTWEDVAEFTVEYVNEKARYTINGLSSGTYRLIEEEAPPGYNLLGHPVEFEVSSGEVSFIDPVSDSVTLTKESNINIITVRNTTGYELPETGSFGTFMYTLGGAVLITAAGCILLYKVIKRRKEDFASS